MAKREVKSKRTRKLKVSKAAKKAVMRKGGNSQKKSTTEPSAGRVLLADDDIAFRDALAEWFKVKEFEVTCTGGVNDSIESVCEGQFDAIILDMHMPETPGGEDIQKDAGLTVTRLLKRYADMDKSVIVIVVTGHPSTRDCFATVDAGAYYLPKHMLDADKHVINIGDKLVTECERLIKQQGKEEPSRPRPFDHYGELIEKFPGKAVAVLAGTANIGGLKTTKIGKYKVLSASTVTELKKMILANPLLRSALPVVLEIWKEDY